MKIFCKSYMTFIFIHPDKEEVANFNFHNCPNCSYECFISGYKHLPYDALMKQLKWLAQSPVDYIYYDYGYLIGGGKAQKVSDEEWQLARLTYSLPSFIGGKMWNKFSNILTKMQLYLTQYKLVTGTCSENLINSYIDIKKKLRIRLLMKAIDEAKQFKHYDPNKAHWNNKKLYKEVRKKGIEYEA